jgi:3-oxoadipate enol-lactonase
MTRSGMVHVNGQELYFERHGDGEPLVLVMGIGYDATLWTLHQVPALSTRFEVIIFDNRDVGRSSGASASYGIADMAEDVAGLLDALGVRRAHLLGLSMGALIAQEFALRHPDRVDRLVLSGPDAAPAANVFHPIAVWRWVKENDPGGAIFAAQQFTWLFSSSTLRNRAAVQQTIDFLSSNPNPVAPAAYARQAEAYLQYDPAGRLGRIAARTLVIVGEQDLLTPPWIAREVADAIPHARVGIIRGDGASHIVPLERPAEFNELVLSFLTERSDADVDGFRANEPAASWAAAVGG